MKRSENDKLTDIDIGRLLLACMIPILHSSVGDKQSRYLCISTIYF